MKPKIPNFKINKSKNQVLQIVFGVLALIGFITHLGAVFLAQISIINNPDLAQTSIISTVATPFTIILMYEVIELALSFKEPLILSVLIQFEVISLIYIRNIFKAFSLFESELKTIQSELFIELSVFLVIAIILFTVVKLIQKLILSGKIKVRPDTYTFTNLKKGISILILIGIGIAFYSYIDSTGDGLFAYITNGFELVRFFEIVFTIMIMADVVLFIINFINDTHYTEVFNNAALIITAVLIRFTLAVPVPYDLLMLLLGCGFFFILMFIQYKLQKKGMSGPEPLRG